MPLLNEWWRKEEKYTFLEKASHLGNLAWQDISPDKKYTWLTTGLHFEFDNFFTFNR